MLPVWVMWTASLHYANVTILVRKQNKEDTPTPHQFDAVAKDKRRGESTAQFFRDQTAHSILQQSLCDARSSFLKVGIDDESPVDSNNPRRTVTTWAARLVYLMLYEHQNHEMSLASSNNSCEKNTTTKFLVFSYGKNGLGANMRLGAVPALMLGLVTDRVVVNVNNANMGPAFLQEPWPWAMCSLRNAECYFRPLSNDCWRTEELETAHVLTKAEARSAFRTGRMPEAHQDDRFLILHVTYRPQREPETLRSFVSHKVRAMATRLRWIQATVVQEAIDIISAVPTISKGEYDYYGANSVIFHGLLLYAMRPNPSLINKLERNVDEVSRRFDVSTVGVPVRGRSMLRTPEEKLIFVGFKLLTSAKEKVNV